MRVLLVSKAFVVGAYHSKLRALAACPDLDLVAAVPPAWRDERGLTRLEPVTPRGYRLSVQPIRFNGSFHLHYYPQLGGLLAEVRPDLLHMDEEPYNFATWHAQRQARRLGVPTLFFTWQNLLRRYPWPFSAFEREVLRQARAGIAGNQEAVAVCRAKGFAGPMAVIPQFGVDPEIYQPRPEARPTGQPFTIGFAGRLVPEKGVELLLRAAATLPDNTQVRLIGAGPERARLLRLAAEVGLAGRLSVTAARSLDMPAALAALDCLVLPSRTRPNWKEQFGRVLVEAMACGVPVVASTCGELPHVVAGAGLIFPEDDVPALTAHLRRLHGDPALRARLGAAGRAHVLARYTQNQIAAATAAAYAQAVNGAA